MELQYNIITNIRHRLHYNKITREYKLLLCFMANYKSNQKLCWTSCNTVVTVKDILSMLRNDFSNVKSFVFSHYWVFVNDLKEVSIL